MKDLQFTITTSTRPGIQNVLADSPEGYDDSQITFERSKKYYGITRKWTIPLKFLKDGARLIREEFYIKGTAGEVEIYIRTLDRSLTSPAYNNILYQGVADMNTFVDDGDRVSVNFKDAGPGNDIARVIDQEYDISGVARYVMYHKLYSEDTWKVVNFRYIKDVVYALLDKMTGGKLTAGAYVLKSDLLDGMGVAGSNEPNQYVLATGRAFRMRDTYLEDDPIKTSLADLFQSIQFKNPGMMITRNAAGKPQIEIEDYRTYFDDKLTPIDLGEVKTLSVTVDADMSINKVRIGWPYKETGAALSDNVNWIGEEYWQMPNTTGNKEIDLVGKYRADAYGINKIITDADEDQDEEIFLCSIYRTSPHPSIMYFMNEGLSKNALTGTQSTGQQNMTLSPRRMLQAVSGRLAGMGYLYAGGDMTMMSGSQNLYNVETKMNSEPTFIAERLSVRLPALSRFVALNFEIECRMTYHQYRDINTDARRLIKFRYLGTLYSGWVLDLKMNLLNPQNVKMTLLADDNYRRLENLVR